MRRIVGLGVSCTLAALVGFAPADERMLEKLDRGIVALPVEKGIFVSWRLLGNEPGNTRFNLYRSTSGQAPVKLNDQPLDKQTCFVDPSADILGDWREEVILPSADGKELRIYTTTIPTDRRFVTLMHDPVYRLSVAWQNVGYNQPPHLGYNISPDAPAK